MKIDNIIILIVMGISYMACSNAGELPIDVENPFADTYKYTMKDHNKIFDVYSNGFPSNIKQIPIVLANDIKEAGLCWRYEDGHREIEINQQLWTQYDDNKRYWLIWHELGHCSELNKNHINLHISANGEICNDDTEEYKCDDDTPLSVMRWYIPRTDQVSEICNTIEIDTFSKSLCNNIGL